MNKRRFICTISLVGKRRNIITFCGITKLLPNCSCNVLALFDIISNLSYDLNKIFSKEISVLFIDREFSKPMLFYNAIIHGVPIYISDKEKYISFVLKALNEMEDFKIFGEKWQFEVIEKRLAKAT